MKLPLHVSITRPSSNVDMSSGKLELPDRVPKPELGNQYDAFTRPPGHGRDLGTIEEVLAFPLDRA